MKNLKKIFAVLIAMAIVCTCGFSVFAAGTDVLVSGSNNTESGIQIESAVAELVEDVYVITLKYSFNNVTVDENTQITVLGYVFDNIEGADYVEGDKANNSKYQLTQTYYGNIRAIEQDARPTGVADGSKTVYTKELRIAKGTGAYQVSEDAMMVIKLGSDAEIGSPDAFFIDLGAEPQVINYTVTYAVGDHGTGSMTGETVAAGTEITLPLCTFGAVGDYEFDGWLVDGVKKAVGDKIIINANTTVTAAWKAIVVIPETYTVTYQAGEGTGDDVVISDVAAGEYTLVAQSFVAPADKEFDGWLVDGVKKAVGDKITISANTIVTAQWKAISGGGTTHVYGDVTGEGRVTDMDWTIILNHISEIGEPNAALSDVNSWQYKAAAGVSGDQRLTDMDWTIILNHISEIGEPSTIVGTEFVH